MSQCYKCETDMVLSKRLICAEPNVVRKNPELMRNEEALSQHQCHNFGCGVTWYSCDKSCQKNFSQYHRSGRSTKQCHFARRSNLVKHLRKYHSRCEKEKETANECYANVNTLQMEDVNLIIGET